MAATYPPPLRVLQTISGNAGKTSISRFATANMHGPYIDAAGATDWPTTRFLDRINDHDLLSYGVPQYLRQCLEHPATMDPWQHFLCAALVRHFSYYRQYSEYYTDTDIIPSLRDRYECLKKMFIIALDTARGAIWTGHRLGRKELIQLDWVLTRNIFHHIPVLFEKCFLANSRLVQELHAMTENDRLGHASNPELLLEMARRKLRNEWISLTNVDDVLVVGSRLADEGQTVQYMKYLLEERWLVLDEMAYVRRLMTMAAASGHGTGQDPTLREAMRDSEGRFYSADGNKENIKPAADNVRAVATDLREEDRSMMLDIDLLGVFR